MVERFLRSMGTETKGSSLLLSIWSGKLESAEGSPAHYTCRRGFIERRSLFRQAASVYSSASTGGLFFTNCDCSFS